MVIVHSSLFIGEDVCVVKRHQAFVRIVLLPHFLACCGRLSLVRDLSKLDGRWKLLFTNNMLGLGKLSPLTLETVYQVVDSAEETVTNIVYAQVSPPLFGEYWAHATMKGRAGASRDGICTWFPLGPIVNILFYFSALKLVLKYRLFDMV